MTYTTRLDDAGIPADAPVFYPADISIGVEGKVAVKPLIRWQIDKHKRRGWGDFAEDKYFVLCTGVTLENSKYITVIDNDVKGGTSGLNNFLNKYNRKIPTDTLTIKSPSGGLHLYFLTDKIYKSTNSIVCKNLDIKSGGGCINTPTIPGYTVSHDAPVANMPDWLCKILNDVDTLNNPFIKTVQNQLENINTPEKIIEWIKELYLLSNEKNIYDLLNWCWHNIIYYCETNQINYEPIKKQLIYIACIHSDDVLKIRDTLINAEHSALQRKLERKI